MNKVYLLGEIADPPRLIEKNPAHLVFALRLPCHDNTAKPYELYPVSAWNLAAIWGARWLSEGQQVLVEGYLTQWKRSDGLMFTQITAGQFFPDIQAPDRPPSPIQF